MSKTCRECLRHRRNVNGTYTCTYNQTKLTEEDLDINSCKNFIKPDGSNSGVKYKDYDEDWQVERTRSCTQCKSCIMTYDERTEMNRPKCVRKEAFVVDPALAGSLCGWFRENKKK